MPKFINPKGTQVLICELCRAIEFEEAFVDEGLTYILICQNCGAHHIENAPLKRVGQQGTGGGYNKPFPERARGFYQKMKEKELLKEGK